MDENSTLFAVALFGLVMFSLWLGIEIGKETHICPVGEIVIKTVCIGDSCAPESKISDKFNEIISGVEISGGVFGDGISISVSRLNDLGYSVGLGIQKCGKWIQCGNQGVRSLDG